MGDVTIPDGWQPPDHLAPFVVGVIHSHHYIQHGMAVTFSGTDTGKGGLNQRWPMSIVIGITNKPRYEESELFGFDYQATGKFKLPCGGLGVCDYRIVPVDDDGNDYPDWPVKFQYDVVRPNPKKKTYESLGDCPDEKTTRHGSQFIYTREAKCGLKERETWYEELAFGYDDKTIADLLPKDPPPVNQGYTTVDKRRHHTYVESYNSFEENGADQNANHLFDDSYQGETFEAFCQRTGRNFGDDSALRAWLRDGSLKC